MNEVSQLAGVVSAIRHPAFSLQLANYLKQFLHFDHLLILGCRQEKHPIYLFDSISSKRDFLFQRYLTGSYLDDPFYRHAQQRDDSGVLRVQDVIKEPHAITRYAAQFSAATSMYDELCLFVHLDESRWLLLFIGCNEENLARFNSNHRELLRLQPLLEALLRQHWGEHSFALSAAASDKTALQQFLQSALNSFGTELLSKREQEITLLLIQGLDTQEISVATGIVEGTVKNHRKKIYAKFRINSLSELFQLFLTHLLSN